jgi:hypothetical protein
MPRPALYHPSQPRLSSMSIRDDVTFIVRRNCLTDKGIHWSTSSQAAICIEYGNNRKGRFRLGGSTECERTLYRGGALNRRHGQSILPGAPVTEGAWCVKQLAMDAFAKSITLRSVNADLMPQRPTERNTMTARFWKRWAS